MKKYLIFMVLMFIIFSLNIKGASVFLKVFNGKNAEVFINNVYKGRLAADGTMVIADLSKGSLKIAIKKTGYELYNKNINISDMISNVSITLIPEKNKIATSSLSNNSAVSAEPVMLTIKTNVSGGDIFLDGRLVGRTQKDGSLILNVKPAKYTLEVKRRGFENFKTVFLMDDMGKKVNLSLIKKTSQSSTSDMILIGMIFFVLLIVIIAVIIVLKVNKPVSTVLGKFKLLDTIGRGGMAIIYRAIDTHNKTEIALKLMDTGHLKDRDLMEKFDREGEAIARINNSFPHAPVVKVFEYGKIGSNPKIPYIALELLKGVSLLDEFKNKKIIHHKHIIFYIKRIAEALEAAHKNKVIHRDVTPDNVILIKTKGGYDIRLIDFGVAKHEYTSYKTLDGSIAGKPPYMSPEQCRGHKIDDKSDIYSLGIILFMLIEGKPPFTGNNPLEIMKMHENEPVPQFKVKVNPEIENLKNFMLQKNKDGRPDAKMVIDIINNIKNN